MENIKGLKLNCIMK